MSSAPIDPTGSDATETAQTTPEHRRAFDAWLDGFFAEYYAARPVNATFIGVHDHDHQLPDYSIAGRARLVGQMEARREALAAIPLASLDLPRRHDYQLADGFLELQILEDSLPQFHRGNSAVYTGEAVFSILSLFLRDSEPLASRVDAAIDRMRAIPAFLAVGRENVTEAPAAWTEQALREARAAMAYCELGLPRLAHDRGISNPEFLVAAGIAREGFEEHARWLEESLHHPGPNTVACGRDAFDRYLARGHFLAAEQDAVWLDSYASEELTRAGADLQQRAAGLDPRTGWQEQLAALSEFHPTASDYYAAFGETWAAARLAAIEAGLVSWPDYPIEYTPTPASDREAAAGLYYLPYRCPPPFGRPEVQRYLVPPVDATMTASEQEQRLRATNDSVIKSNHVVHHGGLGHHVQNWHAFRAASRIGQMSGVDCASRIAMFCGGTLVEGWACYATDLMDEIGYLTPLESLAHAQGQLRMAARALADVRLHTGVWSLDETAAFYEREAGMSPAASRNEAVKNSMFPGAAMMYLTGTNAIHELRAKLAAREGETFSLRDFHDRLLSYGAIPVSMIAADMHGSD